MKIRITSSLADINLAAKVQAMQGREREVRVYEYSGTLFSFIPCNHLSSSNTLIKTNVDATRYATLSQETADENVSRTLSNSLNENTFVKYSLRKVRFSDARASVCVVPIRLS
jgi:hypothetical protein